MGLGGGWVIGCGMAGGYWGAGSVLLVWRQGSKMREREREREKYRQRILKMDCPTPIRGGDK